MTQDTDVRRLQVIQRLNEFGFKPQTIEEILLLIDSMMTGHAPLAHVLVAATEVCNVCELSKTQRHVVDALSCLSSEVQQFQNLSDQSGIPRLIRSGIACQDQKNLSQGEQAQA